MATPGKKGKKQKGKTVSLNDFLNVGGGNDDGSKVVVAPTSWADEMDEYDAAPRGVTEKYVLPTAPKGARAPDASDERIPRDPPYTAYVANLSYDVDEEDLIKFFSKLKVKGVRLPRDGDAETGRLKGFGYADFEDRDSLVEALSMNDHLLKNRKVRVDLATGGRNEQHGGGRDGDRGGRGGGRFDDGADDRTAGDWRSGPPAPPRDDGGRKDRYEPPRDRDDRRDDRRDNRGYGFGGSREGGGGGFGERREGGGGGFDRDRRDDRGGYDRDRRDGDRDGGRREGGGFDRYDRGGSSGGDRYERRGGYERSDRRSPERDAPRERPKLQLAKRTGEAAVATDEQKEAAAKSSIFGGAKPVDTTKREKEIEEKLKKPTPADHRAQKEGSEDGDHHSTHSHESDHHHHDDEAAKPAKPKGASIFGQARPVDTTAREKEIEERLRKKTSEEKPEPEKENGEHKGERKKLVLTRGGGEIVREEIHSADDRHHTHDRRGPRSHHDEVSVLSDDDHGNRGGHRDDGGQRRRDDRGPPKRDAHSDRKHDLPKNDRSTPPPKKFEEAPPPNFAAANKFSTLLDSEEVDSGQDSE